MPIQIKICGLSTPETLATALAEGADFVGFVHYPRSPRHVSPAVAGALAEIARRRAKIVSLLVDPDDALLADVMIDVCPDYVQLHGRETPERVRKISADWAVAAIKAVPVANAADALGAAAYHGAASFVLFDAKPMPGDLPGGNGVPFDWRAIEGQADKAPFMLSGGLNPGNVAEAIRLTRAPMVDVSSGVESAPGQKDHDLIRNFIAAARAAAV
jgi:phosphoribosylanthranilate isomerase